MAEWTWGDLLISNFSDEEQTGFIEVNADAGLPYRREIFTDIQNIVSGTITLDKNDYLSFKDWYRNTIKQGTIPFDFYDCRIGQIRTARFNGKPSYVTNNIYYNISVTLSLEQVNAYIDWFLLTESGDYILTEDNNNILASTEITV